MVDTPVWSEFLRRVVPQVHVQEALRLLIESGDVILIGPIRQEILSGIREPNQFQRLKSALSAFPDEPIRTTDYEQAASMSNECRARGLQGSNTDFLICAVSTRLSAPVFTLDKDFEHFAKLFSVELFGPFIGD